MAKVTLNDRLSISLNRHRRPIPEVSMDLDDRLKASFATQSPDQQRFRALTAKVHYSRGELPEVDVAYGVYSDNMRAIGSKEFLTVDQFIETAQVQPWLATIPQRRNLGQKMSEEYRRNGDMHDAHVSIGQTAVGSEDRERYFTLRQKQEVLAEYDPIEAKGVLKILTGGWGLVGGMVPSVEEGLDEALLGAGTGAAIGAASGAAVTGVPTLGVGAPVGATAGAISGGIVGGSLGLQAGMARDIYYEGKGAMLYEMWQNDVDPKVAEQVASMAAIPYAALGLVQITRLNPAAKKAAQVSFMKAAQKVLEKTVKKNGLQTISQKIAPVALAAGRHADILTREVRDEVMQEIIQAGANDIGEELTKHNIEYDKDYFIERAERFWATAVQSTISMALLPLPGSINVGLKSQGKIVAPEPTITLTPQQEIEYLEMERDEIRDDETLNLEEKGVLYADLDNRIGQHQANLRPYDVNEDNALEAFIEIVEAPADVSRSFTEAAIPEGQTIVDPFESPINPERIAAFDRHLRSDYMTKRKAHMIREQAEMTDKDWKALAVEVTGKNSMRKMTYLQGRQFLDKLIDTSNINIHNDPALGSSKKAQIHAATWNRPLPNWLGNLVTPTDVTAMRIGVGEMLSKPFTAKRELGFEYATGRQAVVNVLDYLNKASNVSRKERRRYQKKGQATAPIERMAELLNTHETTPDFLTKEEAVVFDFFRNLSQTIIRRINEGRARRGEKLISYRKNYYRHVSKDMAETMAKGEADIPPEILYGMKKKLGTKIYNPMEWERQLGSELETMYSRNLLAVTEGMMWTSLKEIHLTDPLKMVKNDLDMMKGIMPEETRLWAKKIMDTVVKGQPTDFDAKFDKAVAESGLAKALNVALRPFGKAISKRPVSRFAGFIGRVQTTSGIALRPKLAIRNLTQKLHDMAFYPLKHVIAGRFPASKTAKKLINESAFFKSYTGIEVMPTELYGRFEKLGMMPFRMTAVGNAKGTMKTAFRATAELITKEKHKDLGWADPQRDYTEPDDFFYPSEIDRLKAEMEYGAAAAQYDYTAIGMPGVFRFKTLGGITKFQSWSLNYFFRFHREAGIRAFTGRTGYGAKIPTSWRLGQARYFILGAPIKMALGYKRSTLLAVLPSGLSPTAAMMFSLYGYVTADDEREREKHLREMGRTLPMFIPYGLGTKDAIDVLSGEKDLEEYLRYTDKPTNDAKDAWYYNG